MAGQAELQAGIDALAASEKALLQREADNAAKLQAIIDDLKSHPAAPDLQAQVDALAAIQADMDAAAQAAPTPAPAAPAEPPPAP